MPPRSATQPRVVVFDAIETLFSLDPVRDRFTDVGAHPATLDVWFARLLRDAFALTALGEYATFPEVALGALATALAAEGIDPSSERVDAILSAFAELPAHADVRPAMPHVASLEIPVLVLTNGARDTTEHLLDRDGLSHLVDAVVTVHDAGRWKPAPEPYLLAVSTAGVEPGDAAMVAVHGWDCFGADRAGLRTGWCSRLEHRLAPVFAPVDVEGATLLDVAIGLVGD